ncbi:MAG TPA: IscS subfamily cysteine desulfurase [Thermoanaerobaculia bacterium]|nr:IscS subfamily cysteine desulfurase [Thermoanaerobaculia bacterium]
MKLPIYMDHHATTPVDPRVLEAMMPYFTRAFGNAASRSHVFGWEAEAAVDEARSQVAAGMNAQPREIVFTSGATESDNMAILGVARAYREKGRHVVTAVSEHTAVLDPCHALEREGFDVTFLYPDRTGAIEVGQVRESLRDDTILVTLMLANNEIGTILPLAEIGAACRERGVLFHSDAVQGFGKVPFDVEEMNVDLASVTAHKLYGPKGIGALYVRARKPRVRLEPILHGGGHERGLRSGTLNVPGIVGFGKAVEISVAGREDEARRLRLLRRRLSDGILGRVSDVSLNGPPLPEIGPDGSLAAGTFERRLPGNLNLAFAGVEGEALLMGLKDVAVSSGSACTSATLRPSHVLKAIGVPDDLAHASIRFGLGRSNTEEEVDYAVGAVAATVRRLRELAPSYGAPKASAG